MSESSSETPIISDPAVSVLAYASAVCEIEPRFKNAGHGPCDHEFLVGADDPHFDASGVRRNQRRILRIALRVQFDAEKAQSLADALADERRVLTDAAGEDQRVQSPERRSEGADPLLRLIAKQRHGFRRPHVGTFLARADHARRS